MGGNIQMKYHPPHRGFQTSPEYCKFSDVYFRQDNPGLQGASRGAQSSHHTRPGGALITARRDSAKISFLTRKYVQLVLFALHIEIIAVF